MGTSDTSNLKSSFPASPIHAGEMTPESIKTQFQDTVIDGTVNDGGHTFGTFSRDYTDAPDLAEVETGAGGLPASPYVPNPVSPGPGSINATDQGDAPDGFGQNPSNVPGSGVGSQLQPKTSSEQQSGGRLGDYVMGRAWGSGA
tara:strand:- start:1280 stop:1711 length:432 start_codon:yes stop_codon:yes gene_type:complete